MTIALIAFAIASLVFGVAILTAVTVAKHFDKPAAGDMRLRAFPGHVAHYDGLWPVAVLTGSVLALAVGVIAAVLNAIGPAPIVYAAAGVIATLVVQRGLKIATPAQVGDAE